MSAIRFVVVTNSTWHKSNGYSSHISAITSTKTGKRLVIDDIGGEGNARSLLEKHAGACNYPEVMSIGRDMPLKQWRAYRADQTHNGSVYEHDVTAEMITALETPEVSS